MKLKYSGLTASGNTHPKFTRVIFTATSTAAR